MTTTKKSNKQPKLFSVYKWFSNKTGWVHSHYILGVSKDSILKNNPQYQNKHLYIITEAQ